MKHIFLPPYHPQSNGLAERFVGTFKRMFLKRTSSLEKERIANFLFHYRNTIHLTTNDSPAILLQGRKLRLTMDLLLPQFLSDRSQEMADSKNDKRSLNLSEVMEPSIGNFALVTQYTFELIRASKSGSKLLL